MLNYVEICLAILNYLIELHLYYYVELDSTMFVSEYLPTISYIQRRLTISNYG